jgi:hypothetical protein
LIPRHTAMLSRAALQGRHIGASSHWTPPQRTGVGWHSGRGLFSRPSGPKANLQTRRVPPPPYLAHGR